MDLQSGFDFFEDGDGECEEQRENLERVASRMARSIVGFCRHHKRFHADELRQYVFCETGIAAPASADRILRLLRQHGNLSYRVLSRRESLYEVIWVKGENDDK